MADPPSASAPLEFLVTAVGFHTTVHVSGECDPVTAPTLRMALLASLACGAIDLELECQNLTYIDSSGLAVLVEAAAAASKRGGSLTVSKSSALLRRLLSITGIDTVVVVA